MLILSRKLDEEIFIEDIVIKVVDISKNSVKLGIQAPKEIPILRGELKKEIETENKNAVYKEKVDTKHLQELLKK